MFGTWTIRVPSVELPRGGLGQGREVWRAGPGGRSIVEEYAEKGAAGAFDARGTLWWDENERGLRILWCEETTEENGKAFVHQEAFTDITSSSFTQVLKAGSSESELKTTVTIRATRVGP